MSKPKRIVKMGKAVATRSHDEVIVHAPSRQQPTTFDLIQQSIAAGIPFGELVAYAEKREADEQRKAYYKAIAAARARIPVIIKNQQGHGYKYADMPSITNIVDPILSDVGLSYDFQSDTAPDGLITVTCMMSHVDGHESEPTSLSARPDKTGSKNDVQAVGSTTTYLQRYTLMLKLGIAASKDTDGAVRGGALVHDPRTISEEEQAWLDKEIIDTGSDYVKFLEHMKVAALADISVSDLPKAKAALASKRARMG